MSTWVRSSIAAMAVSVLVAWGTAEACNDKGSHQTSASAARAAPPESAAAVADKCSCSSAGDCTCKKGSCKCDKCGHRHHRQLISPIKGQKTGAIEIPKGARLDASAGVFI